jgi:AcrR family transcriptional regulator
VETRAGKKSQTRQRLSDTATAMFLERGFDAVRVTEIAAACGVSEKTVYNYFPTKESLLLDRFASNEAALRSALADPALSPVEAAVRVLDADLAAMTGRAVAPEWLARFRALIDSTPSLRAHQRAALERLTSMAAEVLAERTGHGPDEPEPRIAASALLGLWPVYFQALRRYLDGTRSPSDVRERVGHDVRRAAAVIDRGLRTIRSASAAPRRSRR